MPHHAARLVAALTPVTGEPTDAELLTRFVADRDASAFELLVWRHAGLVLRTCRGVLGNRHAAEDAAQAVFLALARQATSVGRSGSVAGWLFRVARRVAVRAARRSTLPVASDADLDAIPEGHSTPASDPDLDRVLHEELARLPDVYRVPVLLCFFEGLSHADAARRLGWPVGTVAGRIARAKDVLAARLTRRGLPLSLFTPLGLAVVSSFVTATTRGAVAFVTGGEQVLSEPVLHLARREVRMAFGKKVFRISSFVLVACSVLAFGLRSGAEPPIPLMRVPEPLPVEEPPLPKIPRAVVEKGFAIAPVTTDLQRRLLGQNELDLCVVVFIDGTQLFKTPSALDVSAFDWIELRKGLKTFLQKGKSVAHFHVYYASRDVASSDGLWMVASAMEALAREEGFVPTKTFSWCGLDKKSEFEKFVWPLREAPGTANSETAVGDEVVRAYPVYTPLSRVFTQSAAVVDILVPLKQTDDTLPDEVDKSLRASTEKLNLGKNQLIDIHVVARGDAKWMESGIFSVCKSWIQSAGLKCGSVAVSGK